MSKYNLIDLYEGMTDDEWEAAKEEDRLEAHPDRDKIKAIQALIRKEKSIKRDNIEEMTGETFNRIDGLTNQNLKAQFLDKFSEIYEDMLEAGDLFDVSDVIDYLCTEMQAYAIDTKMDAGGMMEEEEIEEARPGYNDDGSPKSNDEMSDDEREAFYNDSDFIDEDESLKEHFGRFMKDYQ